mgnify:CR=1 FL=1
MNKPGFWDNIDQANKLNKQLTLLKKETSEYNRLTKEILSSKEIVELIELEYSEELLNELESSLIVLSDNVDELEIDTLLSGEYDNNDCFLEIHPGAGGTESCDWASMLLRMYQRFCDKNNFTYQLIEQQAGEEAGIKSATLHIKGDYAYGYLKCERGVHRLVRISPFDSNKRRHTSFASVSVVPEIDQNINIEIKDEDIRIDTYCASGHGGQGVNTTPSAVRITHLPTNTVVTCQNERSQIQNKEQAMKVLRARLYEAEQAKQDEAVGSERKSKVGTGDRSEKIRTYNYPQNRVTDHRIGYTTNTLDRVMNGALDDIIEALITEDQRRKLEGSEE